MSPQQKLWFLNSFQYTWFDIAPEHAIISADPDDATHFANVVHLTKGWKSPPAIEPLCHRFNKADYRCRRLWTPVMDDKNLCSVCRETLLGIDSTILKHGSEVIFAPNGLIRRGGFANQQQNVATIISEFMREEDDAFRQRQIEEDRVHHERLAQLHVRLGEQGVLLPPLPIPALPAPNPCQQINDNDDAFRAWRDEHLNDGFIINRDLKGGYVVHRANCSHMEGFYPSTGEVGLKGVRPSS